MELTLRHNPIFINETILEETVEQPVECDALLPDYCPDIRRILKCTLTPTVMNRTITAGRLEVEGLAGLHILYVSAGGELARGEYKVPFSRMMELHGEAVDPVITVTMAPGQVSCRAVNQRRLDIRGSVLLHAAVTCCREEGALCGCEETTLQLRRRQLRGTRLAGCMEKEQHLSQSTVLEGNGAPITRVLRTEARVTRCEEKQTPGRLTLRGEVETNALSANEEGGWEASGCTMPFEIALEAPGMPEDAPYDVHCMVSAVTAEPGTDEDGEYRSLDWSVTVQAAAQYYLPYETTVCTDAYSTRYESAYRTRTAQMIKLCNTVREAETWKETLPLPEETEELVALWLREEGCTAHPEGDGITAEARLGLTMLARMADGELYSFDRTLEPQRHIPAPEGARWGVSLSCRGCQWSTAGNELTLTCELCWRGAVCQTVRETMLEEITVEDRPKGNLMPRGLYIYMASQGESLWEIAKHYNTSEEKIREDNGEPGENCAGGPLLIPV